MTADRLFLVIIITAIIAVIVSHESGSAARSIMVAIASGVALAFVVMRAEDIEE